MKIAVVGARGVPAVEGGAEKNAEALFPRVANEHDVTLYAIRGYTQIDTYKGVKIKYAPNVHFLGTEKLPCYIYALFDCIREKPEIVHLQGLGSAIFLIFYKLLGFKVVVRYGSADYDLRKWSIIGRWGFLASEWQLRFADAVIAVAPSLKARLEQRGFRVRIDVIPNALDPLEERSEEEIRLFETYGLERENYAIGIGRLTVQKDFLTLIEGFKRFRDGGGVRIRKLVIVGGDDGSGYAQRLAAEVSGDVVLTGRLPRPATQALLSGCAVYVNSSVHEGMSNAVLEAVSLGRPILVSDIVENRDLPIHERHFFETGDAASLADSLAAVAANPDLYVASTESFATWDDVAAKTLALYASLFKQRVTQTAEAKGQAGK